MGQLKFLSTLFLIAICFSCSGDDELTREQEAQILNQMFFEIVSLASSVSCNDSSEWAFTSYGSKTCGGPIGYIAYSTNINTELFLEKIEKHRTAQQEFNEKWEIRSNCSVPPQPSGIICENGNPIFEY